MSRVSYSLTAALIFILTAASFAQITYQTRFDTVASGGTFLLTQTGDAPIVNDPPKIMGERIPFIIPQESYNSGLNQKPDIETIFIDADGGFDDPNAIGDNALQLNKFIVSHSNNIIPPDPTIAVGPEHVMVMTNHANGIFIYDKEGNLLRNVNSNSVWTGVWPRQDGDPQVIFDHYAGRWVMVFMQIDDGAQAAGDLIAYSDDESPFGTWYTYRLPSTLWGDFPQIGFDHQAIYIAANAFSFSGFGQYPQVKIISKAELYASNGGPVSFTTFYNISVPGAPQNRAFNLRPSFQYSVSDDHYLLWANRTGYGSYGLYKISNPVTAPVMTAVSVPTTYYYNTPNANQLGGGSPLIESGGSAIRIAPILRDGYLYAAHSVGNSNQTAANIRYLKIDISNNTLVESFEYGTTGVYHLYPALAVDENHNIAITCSRSSTSQYIGSYYFGRRASDPAGLSNAYELQPGLGNYVLTFGGTRNRWGDYLGIFIDPSTGFNFWMVSQFASGTNQYAMAVGEVRLQPYSGIFPYVSTTDYDFGSTEVGDTSDVVTVYLSNYGEVDMIISNIPESAGDFHRLSSFSFPLTLSTYDSVEIELAYVPTSAGLQNEFLAISNNSASFTGLNLTATGYIANPALARVLYGISGSPENGNVSTFDLATGTGTTLGPSGYNDIFDIEIDNNSNRVLGIKTLPIASEIYRVNAVDGSAYLAKVIDIPELYSLAYDTLGQLYATSRNGNLYSIDTTDWSNTLISTLDFERVAIAFDPMTNDLWGSVKNLLGSPRDRIVKFNPSTGDTVFVGRTGYNVNTTDIVFDENGVMYGIKGTGNVVSDLFTIDKTTGTGTLIGATGIKDVKGIGYSTDVPTSVNNNLDMTPVSYTLEQNFPNPFNPSTTINFSVPNASVVKLTVYNILGETVNTLLNKELQTGNYSVVWNADDLNGRKVSSGIYFYEIKATSDAGNNFNQIRKMVLLK